MLKFSGECRITGSSGQPNRVRVTDGDSVWDDVDETSYRAACYKPDFDDLPWCIGHAPPKPAPTPNKQEKYE